MKKSFLCLAILLSAGFSQAEVSNLIPNGNLDTASPDDASLPASWRSTAEGDDEAGTKWTYEPEGGEKQAWLGISTSGSQGIKQWISDAFNIVPDQKYRITFSYRTDATNSHVRIDFWGDAAATQWKGMVQIMDGTEYNLPSLSKDKNWKTKKEAFASPAGGEYATVSLVHCAAWGSSGFDEINIEEED